MKSVAIVGGGPSRKQAPWGDPTVWEIWTLNEAASKSGKRSEVVFQMHDPGVYQKAYDRNDPGYWEWLQQLHNIKIYMLKEDPLVPDSLEYPLDEICKEFLSSIRQKGKEDRELLPVKLFTFSGSYAIALALYKKYSRIRIYGIDLIHTEEYRYQRESFAFWVGIAAGRGVDLEIYGADDIFKKPLYGYETFKEFRNMKFDIEDRVMLHEMVLPKQADMVSMRIIRDLKRMLEFSQEELDQWEIRAIPPQKEDPLEPGWVNATEFLQYRWKPEAADYVKEIEIGEPIRKVVLESFKDFDKNGRFTEKLLSLYDKFTYE